MGVLCLKMHNISLVGTKGAGNYVNLGEMSWGAGEGVGGRLQCRAFCTFELGNI